MKYCNNGVILCRFLNTLTYTHTHTCKLNIDVYDNDNDNEISFILTQVNTSLLATLL